MFGCNIIFFVSKRPNVKCTSALVTFLDFRDLKNGKFKLSKEYQFAFRHKLFIVLAMSLYFSLLFLEKMQCCVERNVSLSRFLENGIQTFRYHHEIIPVGKMNVRAALRNLINKISLTVIHPHENYSTPEYALTCLRGFIN